MGFRSLQDSNDDLAVGISGVIGGTAGSLLFVGTGAILSQDNANLFWNETTNSQFLRIGSGTSPGQIRLLEGSGGGTNYVALIAPATLSANLSLTLPTADAAGVMVSDGLGALSLTANPTITNTSGTLLTLAISNSAASGTIGQTISFGNTQSQSLKGLSVAMGTSDLDHNGVFVDMSGVSSGSAYGVYIDHSLSSLTGIPLNIRHVGSGSGSPGLRVSTTSSDSGRGIQYYADSGASMVAELGGDGVSSRKILYGYVGSSTGWTNFRGIDLDINPSNSQDGWRIEYSQMVYSGSSLANRATDGKFVSLSRTSTRTSGTTADNYKLVNFKRTNVQNGAGGTLTAAGSVGTFENVATQTAGTLTDTVTVLQLLQDADSTGNLITGSGDSGTTSHFTVSRTGDIGWNNSDVVLSNSATDRLRYTGTSVLSAETGGFCVADESTVAKCLFMGYDVSGDYGFIQAIQFGTATKKLVLNGTGGQVGIGISPSTLGPLTVHAATDENFLIRPHSTLSDGILIQSIVDAYNANRSMEFRASNFLFNTGNVAIGTGAAPTTVLDLLGADNSTVVTVKINATQANVTTSDIFADFRSTSGSEGTIAGTGVAGVIAYNTFTGSHFSQSDEFQKKQIVKQREIGTYVDENTGERVSQMESFDSFSSDVPVGTILSSIDEMCVWPNSENLTLPKCKITEKKEDKAVYGVFGGVDDDGDILVLGLGSGVVRVNNEGGNIEIGDFICSSSTPGVGMRYDGDDMHVVVCKARQSNKGNKEATIACTILSG